VSDPLQQYLFHGHGLYLFPLADWFKITLQDTTVKSHLGKKNTEIQHAQLQKMWVMEDDEND
jgi:hypothetical protein